MNKYLKDNLILGDSLENFFGWITLPMVTQIQSWAKQTEQEPFYGVKWPFQKGVAESKSAVTPLSF